MSITRSRASFFNEDSPSKKFASKADALVTEINNAMLTLEKKIGANHAIDIWFRYQKQITEHGHKVFKSYWFDKLVENPSGGKALEAVIKFIEIYNALVEQHLEKNSSAIAVIPAKAGIQSK